MDGGKNERTAGYTGRKAAGGGGKGIKETGKEKEMADHVVHRCGVRLSRLLFGLYLYEPQNPERERGLGEAQSGE